MDPSKHPQDQQIQAYLKTPDALDFNDLRLHLASCGYCRRRTELTAMLRDQGHWLESERVAADSRVAELVAGKLDAEQASKLKQELQKDPAKLRAALHYASHAQAMSELQTPAQTPFWTLTRLWLKAWLNYQAPIWKTVPVIAVLMTVATILVSQYNPSKQIGQPRIIAFEDNLTIRFAAQNEQPGIGFFAQQGVSSKPFAGMNIDLRHDNGLQLSWPEVEGVQTYRLKLQVFRDGETRVLARTEVNSPYADLEIEEPLSQHRYEWVLSGDTEDNRAFQASGGFVISRD